VVEWIAVLAAGAAVAVGIAVAASRAIDFLAPPVVARAAVPAVEPAPALPSLRMGDLPAGDGTAVLEVAERLLALGIREKPPGSNGGPAVLALTDGHAEPWCADFVSWVLRAAGRPFTGGASGGWRLAWTPDVRAWFLARDRYRPRLVADPQPGDVVWFGHGHVGIVRRADASALEAIEGNADDRVRVRRYPGWRADTRIDGFGRP
jgi:hypothetical protein